LLEHDINTFEGERNQLKNEIKDRQEAEAARIKPQIDKLNKEIDEFKQELKTLETKNENENKQSAEYKDRLNILDTG